ncbi:MAG: elongation factor Ts [Acholeplasmataceae bacterium]|nr:elongation factor Ts [Acholeplasmataceae bacterium]
MPTIEKIKILREKTGAGMMDCKRALIETNGDLDAAVDYLREKGLSKAASKQSRIAAEGLTNAVVDANVAYLYEVNSETDFVAKNDTFITLVENIGKSLLASTVTNSEEALLLECDGETVEKQLSNQTARIGEKITLRRVQRFEKKDDEVFGLYIHQAGRMSTITILAGGDEEMAKNVAMHVTASKPTFIDRESVDPQVVEHEKEVLTNQALNEGKPAKIVEKMVEGRIVKFFEEICLTEQAYIKDPDLKVKDYLKKENAKVLVFGRLEVGEGIEKRQEDFAAEVEAQLKK